MTSIGTIASDASSVAATAWLVVLAAVGVALLAFFVAAVVSVARLPVLTPVGRAGWILAVLVFPFLGPLAWFSVGRGGPASWYRSSGA